MSSSSRRRRGRGRHRRRAPPGTPPGTLVVDPEAPRPIVRVLAYGPDGVEEATLTSVREVVPYLTRFPVSWLNIDGLGDLETIQVAGEIFGIHPLALEDVVNVHQRAKVEKFENHLFIVARTAAFDHCLETEQLAMFLGANYVVTFQERTGDPFDRVRERIRRQGTILRRSGPDYLAYALLDLALDCHFPVLEAYGERLEALEDEVVVRPTRRLIGQIHEVKRDLLALRRQLWPQREALGTLLREESTYIRPETRVYLRDCYDHAIQLMDLVENYRDLGSSLTDVYLSAVSNRMNEVMKVLTIISTIFIPLGFLASVYGMNFDTRVSPWNMPELEWRWGYPFALSLMGGVAAVMLLFFHRKGWLGGGGEDRGLAGPGDEHQDPPANPR